MCGGGAWPDAHEVQAEADAFLRGDGLSVVRAARQPAVRVRLGPIPLLLLPHTFGIRNCLLTQFSSRPSRRKRAAVRAAKPRLSRKLSGV